MYINVNNAFGTFGYLIYQMLLITGVYFNDCDSIIRLWIMNCTLYLMVLGTILYFGVIYFEKNKKHASQFVGMFVMHLGLFGTGLFLYIKYLGNKITFRPDYCIFHVEIYICIMLFFGAAIITALLIGYTDYRKSIKKYKTKPYQYILFDSE